jgi:hypothetical protein
MKKYFLIVITLLMSLVFSCKEDKKKEVSSETSQMKQVIAIHDEVMPKMGEIGRLVAALRKKIDTDQGSSVDKKTMEDLQDAHKSMMEWMQDLGDNFDSEEILDGKLLTPAKQELLDKEEEKVKIVKEKINSSIAKAKALLSE